MLVLHVTLQVQPEHAAEFMEVARYDAVHSVQDEPGCLRFDVIQDNDDPNRFYFYEIYRDEAAFEAHRQTAHFKHYFEKTPVATLVVGVMIEKDPIGNDARRKRRLERLDAEAVCVLCGERAPESLLATSVSLLERHHVE